MWMGNTLSPPLLIPSCIDYFERLSSLLRDPVYYGRGVRKGTGEPVLLVPGFFGGDWMMAAMARWLARIGYRPYLSGIDWNVGCPGRTVELLGRRIQKMDKRSTIGPRASTTCASERGLPTSSVACAVNPAATIAIL